MPPMSARQYEVLASAFRLLPGDGCNLPPADNKEQHPSGSTTRTSTLYYFSPFSIKPGYSPWKPAAQQSESGQRFALTRLPRKPTMREYRLAKIFGMSAALWLEASPRQPRHSCRTLRASAHRRTRIRPSPDTNIHESFQPAV